MGDFADFFTFFFLLIISAYVKEKEIPLVGDSVKIVKNLRQNS